MTQNLSMSQLTLLVGGALLIGGLLVLVIYLLHKTLRSRLKPSDLTPKAPRPANQATFMAATFQSAIASMKAREKELSESLRAAELRAEENLRILETIAREMPGGLMIFNREGLIALSNSAVRSLVGIDT